MNPLTLMPTLLLVLLLLVVAYITLGPVPPRKRPRDTEERKNRNIQREIEKWRDGL